MNPLEDDEMAITTYFHATKMSWINYRAYFGEFLASLFFAPFIFLFQYFIFKIIYYQKEEIGGFSFKVVMAYSAIVILLTLSYPRVKVSYVLEREISSGTITTRICLPINYPFFYFTTYIPQTMVSIFTGIVGYIFIANVLHLFPAIVAINVVVFIIWTLLAAYLSYSIFFLIGASAFYFGRSSFLCDTIDIIQKLLGGVYFPIIWLPVWALSVVNILPFEIIYGIPGQILINHVSLHELKEEILILVFWVFFITFLMDRLWKKAITKFDGAGG
jgi:ABC-2 type transport system permease protein